MDGGETEEVGLEAERGISTAGDVRALGLKVDAERPKWGVLELASGDANVGLVDWE